MDHHEDIQSDLLKKILRMEIVLRDNGFDSDGKRFEDNVSCAEISSSSALEGSEREQMSMMGMDPENPTVLTKYFENKVNELHEELEEKEDENERLVARVEELESMVTNLRQTQSISATNSLTVRDDTPISTPPDSVEGFDLQNSEQPKTDKIVLETDQVLQEVELQSTAYQEQQEPLNGNNPLQADHRTILVESIGSLGSNNEQIAANETQVLYGRDESREHQIRDDNERGISGEVSDNDCPSDLESRIV